MKAQEAKVAAYKSYIKKITDLISEAAAEGHTHIVLPVELFKSPFWTNDFNNGIYSFMSGSEYFDSEGYEVKAFNYDSDWLDKFELSNCENETVSISWL